MTWLPFACPGPCAGVPSSSPEPRHRARGAGAVPQTPPASPEGPRKRDAPRGARRTRALLGNLSHGGAVAAPDLAATARQSGRDGPPRGHREHGRTVAVPVNDGPARILGPAATTRTRASRAPPDGPRTAISAPSAAAEVCSLPGGSCPDRAPRRRWSPLGRTGGGRERVSECGVPPVAAAPEAAEAARRCPPPRPGAAAPPCTAAGGTDRGAAARPMRAPSPARDVQGRDAKRQASKTIRKSGVARIKGGAVDRSSSVPACLARDCPLDPIGGERTKGRGARSGSDGRSAPPGDCPRTERPCT